MNSEEMLNSRNAYCKALYEQWYILDLRGIIYIPTKRATSMPLEDVFVLPDLLVSSSVAIYETPQHRQDNDYPDTATLSQEVYTLDEEQPLPIEQEDAMHAADTDGTVQRKDLRDVLSRQKQKQVVILGHPGAGKTTLLRYLLLQLLRENRGERSSLRDIPNIASFIPLYIPLTTYAEIYRSSDNDVLLLDDFLPLYLKSANLDTFTDFLRDQIETSHVMFLLDGLDELESDVRNMLVVELKRFASTYKEHYFIVTSRIVGYTDALSRESDYQEYPLAPLSPQQIKDFTRQWYLSHETCIKRVSNRETAQETAEKEAAKLWQAIESNPRVGGLAINPLFLTILALMQYQRSELPGHRVELFKRCVTTLVESRPTAKGQSESSRLNESELVQLLRPLAFTMIEKGISNSIEEKPLLEYIAHNLETRRIPPEIPREPERLIDMISKTGIFVKRGKKQEYGFLHQIFAEYFAALDLVDDQERDLTEFIRQHLHQPRWREVILLTLGVIGVTNRDNVRAAKLIQQGILQAKSPYEDWLQRDLLFAGRCLADDIGMTIDCKDTILEQIVYLYLTTPHFLLRRECLEVFATWKGTRIVEDAEKLVLPLCKILVANTESIGFFLAFSEPAYLGPKILAHYHHLSQHYQDNLFDVLRVQATTILHRLDPNEGKHIDSAFSLLTSSSHLIRQIAVTVLAQTRNMNPDQRRSLVRMVSDPHPEVRRASVAAMKHLNPPNPLVLDALFTALSDPVFDVREATAATLGILGEAAPDNPLILNCLLQTLLDPYQDIQKTAATALGKLGTRDQRTIKRLLSRVADSNHSAFAREAAISVLGQLGSGRDDVVVALISILSDNAATTSLRQAAATALKSLQADKKGQAPFATLLSLLSDPSLDQSLRQAVATTLGSLANGNQDIMKQLLRQLETNTLPDPVYSATITALGYTGIADPRVKKVLLSTLRRPVASIQQEAISAFEHLDMDEPEVLTSLREILLHSEDFCVREVAAATLGHLDARSDIGTFLTAVALQDTAWQVRQAAIVALRELKDIVLPPDDIDKLTRLLGDQFASVREKTVDLLGYRGADQPLIIGKLQECLSNDPDPLVCQVAVRALGHARVAQEDICSTLLMILADLNTAFTLREATIEALTELCEHHPPSRDRLRSIVSDESYNPTLINEPIELLESHPPSIEQLRSIVSDESYNPTLINEPIHRATIKYNQSLVRSGIWRSLKLLRSIGSNQIDLLMTILSNDSSAVCKDSIIRQVTISALSELDTDDPRPPDRLLDILLDQETPQDVKKAAICTLGQIGKRRIDARQAMITALLKDDILDKRAIIQALGKTGKPGANEIITALLDLLTKTESGASQIAVNLPDREAAIMALGKIGGENEDVVKALLPLLHQRDNPDPYIRQATVRALGQIGNAHVAEKLLHLLGYSKVAGKDPDPIPKVRKEAVLALAQIGYNQPNVITGLLQIYEDMLADDLVRSAFLSTLVHLGSNDKRVSERLLETFGSANSALKRDIATALSQAHQNDPRIIEALCRNLSDHDSSVRKRVAITLGTIGRDNEHVHTVLIDALPNADPCIKKEIVIALGNMSKQEKSPAEIGRIHAALREALSDSTSYVRREAAFALLHYHNQQPPERQALNIAHSLLFASDSKIRIRAVLALGQPTNNQPQIIRALLRALSDDKKRIRKAAAYALARIHSQETDIGALLLQLLQRYKPIVDQEISTRSADTVDSTLFALSNVAGEI